MEPLDEKELSQLLRKWEAPDAPASLTSRILPQRGSWWRWLITGTIRIPAPVGVAVVLLVVLWLYSNAFTRRPAVTQQPSGAVSFADFQPVQQLEPRVVRGQ